MKLLSWNVNGIRSVRTKGFDQTIKKLSPDITCLQETKISPEKLVALDPVPNQAKQFASCAARPGYSGVLTLSKTSDAKLVSVGLGKKEFDSEGRFVITNHKEFTLYNIYFPSGTSGEARQQYKYRFLSYLLHHLTKLPKKQRERIILCGDFNICHRPIDIHHPETATRLGLTGFLPKERKWIDELIDAGFVDAFRFVHGDEPSRYSWWSFRANSRQKNLGWRIDYFFVAKKLSARISGAEIHEKVAGSDHCPITLELH